MNISRRDLLLGGIGLAQTLCFTPSFARGKAKAKRLGIYSIARRDWPPAIVPDHVAFIDKGYSCFTDQFGRLTIVDLRKADSATLIGELFVKTKKLIDSVAVRQHAYLITQGETSEGDAQYELTTVSLSPPTEPSVLSRIILKNFTEASCLTATVELICVGGVTASGANQVAIFETHGHSPEPEYRSSINMPASISRLDLLDKNLVVLQSGTNSQLDYVNLVNPQLPQRGKSMKLNGDFHLIARNKDVLVLAGQSSDGVCEAKTVILEPAPHLMQSETLTDLKSVLSIAAQKDRFYILGERGSERKMLTYVMGKDLRLSAEETVTLPSNKVSPGSVSALAVNNRRINIATGWQGVDVLSLEKLGWQHSFTYNIPRFPASGVVTWNDWVLLAGSDLKLYDITKSDKPVLVTTAESGGTIKSLATAGVFVLCLAKNSLSLRRMDNLAETIASISASGQDMSYDKKSKNAYVLKSDEKKTTITPIKTYSNKLVADKPFELPIAYRSLLADSDNLLFYGMNNLALYRKGESLDLLGKISLDGLAIRDVAMTDELIVATAIDSSSKGFLVLLSKDSKDLARIGATDLPQDGIALAVAGKQAVIVGKSIKGEDMVSVVDISIPAIPHLVASFPSIEAASAVTIKDNLAIVVGRGLEIFSLG